MTPYLGMFFTIYTVGIQFILIINTNSIINQYRNFRGWKWVVGLEQTLSMP